MKIDKYVKDLWDKIDSIPSSSTSSNATTTAADSSPINDDDNNNNSEHESFESRFNRFVREVMPYYKAEVMRIHNIKSDEEYKRRVLEGDNSIYLPQS